MHIQQDRNRVVNRIARLLETTNIKLASLASNIVGQSGMAMLRLLAGGGEGCRTSGGLCARFDAYQDTGTDSGAGWPAGCAFRWMLAQLLAKLDRLEEERACVDARIDVLATEYKDRLQRLSTIPGVDRTTALVLLAECGEDMACRSSRRQLIWPVGPGCVRAMPKVPANASPAARAKATGMCVASWCRVPGLLRVATIVFSLPYSSALRSGVG